MEHWRAVLPPDRLIEIDYENLIADREAVTRRLIAFTGLDWHDSCLEPERNERVTTASCGRRASRSTPPRSPGGDAMSRGSASSASCFPPLTSTPRHRDPWLSTAPRLRSPKTEDKSQNLSAR